MRLSRWTALSSAIAVTSLAACSGAGDDQPTTLPPATTSIPSVVPTGAPPTTSALDPIPTTSILLPDEHVASVDALVEDFFAALNEVPKSKNFTELDSLYLERCQECLTLRGELQAWLANDQTIEGGAWTLWDYSTDALPSGTSGGFTALAFRERVTVRSAAGEIIQTEPATSVRLFNGVAVAADTWVIDNIGVRDA